MTLILYATRDPNGMNQILLLNIRITKQTNPNPSPNPIALMNPSEPWGDSDDGLRFLCCVACVPSVIPGTSANALHVSKVRRPPCAFEVPPVGC